jgi:nitroimidazol reductase NimA-like FMN-containing flavoprotein (pyridoxamine 5'-phosphate oxidase superfamily)
LILTDRAKLRERIREVLGLRAVAVLSTFGDEYPHSTLVAVAHTDDLATIVFATSRETRKYGNMRRDDRATILVDTRTNEEEDFHRATVVTAHGRTSEVSGPEDEALRALFLARHPYLETFLQAPTTILMKMEVLRYDVVKRFQNVFILDMDHDLPR